LGKLKACIPDKGMEEDLQDEKSIMIQNAFKEYYKTETEPSDEIEPSELRGRFEKVLRKTNEIMKKLPRCAFLSKLDKPWTYLDMALPILMGHKQTISQPTFVQWMTAILNPKKSERALVVGTGSGYQTAVLAEMTKEVHTVDIYEDLSREAKRTCNNLGIKNITYYVGDGSGGLPEQAKQEKFDIIIYTYV